MEDFNPNFPKKWEHVIQLRYKTLNQMYYLDQESYSLIALLMVESWFKFLTLTCCKNKNKN